MARKPKRGSGINRKGRSKSAERFVKLDYYVLDSPAYCSLRSVSRALLVEIWKRYNGSNNGEIGFSVRDAAEALGVGKDTVCRAFDELIDRGFLIVRADASFTLKEKLAREFEITALPLGDKLATWKAEEKNTVLKIGTVGPQNRDCEVIPMCSKA